MLLSLVNRGDEVPGLVPVAVITIAIVWSVFLLTQLLKWLQTGRQRKTVDQGVGSGTMDGREKHRG